VFVWRKVRLLQIYERERLQKVKENSKLIKLKVEINGVIEGLIEENEFDITDNLICAAATVITQTMNEPSKRSRN
jgi:hypothetical protein